MIVAKNYRNLSSLKFHIKIDHLRQLLKCSLYDLNFRSKDSLRRHTDSHKRREANENFSQYICPVCDFESKDQEKVLKHFRDKHNIEEDDTVPCPDPECNQVFAAVELMKKHFDIHKKFKCDVCYKKYEHQNSLDDHIKIIHKGFKLQCIQCDKEFSRQSALNRHTRNFHKDGDYGYGCYQCEFIGTRLSYVKDHVRKVHMNSTLTKEPDQDT